MLMVALDAVSTVDLDMGAGVYLDVATVDSDVVAVLDLVLMAAADSGRAAADLEVVAALDYKLDAAAANDADVMMISYLGGVEKIKSALAGVADADWVASAADLDKVESSDLEVASTIYLDGASAFLSRAAAVNSDGVVTVDSYGQAGINGV